MDQNPQILELVKCFEGASNIEDDMEARTPLYRAQELQKQMSPEDFYAGLKLAALKVLENGNPNMVYEIADIDSKICQDADVKKAVSAFFQKAQLDGFEDDEELKTLFAL